MSKTSKEAKLDKLGTGDAWAKIIELAEHLQILRALTQAQDKRVSEAVEVLRDVQANPRRRDYQVFLYDVLRKSSHQAVLLCAVALGQTKVALMQPQHRRDLISKLENGRSDPPFNYPAITSLAIKAKIDERLTSFQGDTDSPAIPGISLAANNSPPKQLVGERTLQEKRANNLDNAVCVERAETHFESAIVFAAESITDFKEREAWISSCRGHLYLLKRLTCNERRRKRKHETNVEPEPSILDSHDRATKTRLVETTGALTDVNLRAGNTPLSDSTLSQTPTGSDCQVRMIEGVGDGEMVLQERKTSEIGASDTNIAFTAILPEVRKMETFLGEYLFRGMRTTRTRHQEEDSGLRFTTNTVRLHTANQHGDDFKLEVMLSFETGREIWAEAFPS